MSEHKRESKEKITDRKNPLQVWFSNDRTVRILEMLFIILIYFFLENFSKSIALEKYKTQIEIASNILLTLDITLFIEFLINQNYKKHFRQSIYEIITDVNLMKEFIDQKRKKDIMYAALHANLGDHITKALYDNILDNYLDTYNNLILREDYNFNIYLSQSTLSGFYAAKIQITFQIPPHMDDLELRIMACSNHIEVQEKMQKISGLNKQLVFPLILADGTERIEKNDLFSVTIYKNNVLITDYEENEDFEKMIRISGNKEHLFIKLEIDTLLNKNENFFQEDIFCIHKGYSLTLGYESGLLKKCKCYHSCKSKGLVTIQNNNFINIHTNGILLPENNFVFIWEK